MKWKGYSLKEATWEPEEHFGAALDVIHDYKRQSGLATPKKKRRIGSRSDMELTKEQKKYSHDHYHEHELSTAKAEKETRTSIKKEETAPEAVSGVKGRRPRKEKEL